METLNNQENQPQPPVSVASTPVIPDVTPKKKNYLPWLLGILILLIAVTIFTFYKFTKGNSKIQPALSPSETSVKKTDSTANWKTYTNENVGFTFKYPANWIENGVSLEEKIGENGVNKLSQKGISMKVYENSGNLSALDFLDTIFYRDYTDQGSKSLKETYMKQYRENSLLRSVVIDGKPFTSIEELIEPHGSDGRGIWITIKENGLLLRSYPSADNQNQQRIFDQILSTFKFMDSQIESVDNTNQPTNLPEVPVYPQAKFTKKEFIPPCPGEQATCNVDSYTWESPGNINEVISWYEQDQSKSGWKLSGGAGLEGTNRYGSFSNGKVRYWLTIYLLGPEGPVGIELRGPLN